MTDRERWIVYPLIFFALGAAIRDKLFRHVASKEVVCERLVADEIHCIGGINCRNVMVVDRDDPRLVLVQLGQGVKQPGDGGDASSLGLLVLRDSKGEAICGVTNDSLYVKSVVCESAQVVASRQSKTPLIQLGSVAAHDNRTGRTGEVGILSVNNQSYYGAPGQQFTPIVPRPQPTQPQQPGSPQPNTDIPAPAETSPDPELPKTEDAQVPAEEDSASQSQNLER
ncbi:hypothetical protein [Adhaeretor mobilis]|uniref:Uncharacterized protein n=1 Tax=Adhaeretor mobilis TaxID=1930276 RepID=A0A517N0N5_9BACT|nr:hypothetical protein [Adhaeretor mobilis]QDT00701.1 hypothetical protein HG15A2_40410 [Adhaeretor mobilis]